MKVSRYTRLRSIWSDNYFVCLSVCLCPSVITYSTKTQYDKARMWLQWCQYIIFVMCWRSTRRMNASFFYGGPFLFYFDRLGLIVVITSKHYYMWTQHISCELLCSKFFKECIQGVLYDGLQCIDVLHDRIFLLRAAKFGINTTKFVILVSSHIVHCQLAFQYCVCSSWPVEFYYEIANLFPFTSQHHSLSITIHFNTTFFDGDSRKTISSRRCFRYTTDQCLDSISSPCWVINYRWCVTIVSEVMCKEEKKKKENERDIA